MRVAILHDYLTQFGGAERVLERILEIFPNADLYTLMYDEGKMHGMFKERLRKTSFLDHRFFRKWHRLCIPAMPLAAQLLSSDTVYDLVISSTAGYAKGINVRGKYHVCYCHSPLRYAWQFEFLRDLPHGVSLVPKFLTRPIAAALRRWDKRASEKVNVFIANSHFIAEKIRSYYGRDAYVVYPPIDTVGFTRRASDETKDYYLMAGRFLYYKRFDLGLRALQELKLKLKVVGSGPEEEKIRKIANPAYTEFLGNVPDAELRRLFASAKGVIFPQEEDFGMVAAEAQACGAPVLAYAKGGGSEIVRHKETGLLFTEQTKEAIQEAVRECELREFDRGYISRTAERFSKDVFVTEFMNVLRRSGFALQEPAPPRTIPPVFALKKKPSTIRT